MTSKPGDQFETRGCRPLQVALLSNCATGAAVAHTMLLNTFRLSPFSYSTSKSSPIVAKYGDLLFQHSLGHISLESLEGVRFGARIVDRTLARNSIG